MTWWWTDTKRAVAEAISKAGTPPCEGCRNFNLCKYNRLACGLFKHYVGTEGEEKDVPVKYRTIQPTRKFYNDLFTDFD